MKRNQAIELVKSLYDNAVETVTKLPYPFYGVISTSEHAKKNTDDFAFYVYIELYDEAANCRLGSMITCSVFGFLEDQEIRERVSKALVEFTEIVAEQYNKLEK